jgi:hypothetical protein
VPDAAATIQTALCELLTEHGLAGPPADALSAELIRDYPLVRRQGVRASVLRLCEHGMAPGEAREAALELLAFELLGRAPYERVLEIVAERSGGRDPLGVCLRAARLRRQVSRGVRIHEPRPIGARLVRLALSWLGSPR